MSLRLPALVDCLIALRIIPPAAVAQLDGSQAPTAQAVLDAGRLAEQTCRFLDDTAPSVALIARMGQDLSQFGLTYSHLGFALRLANGEWGVRHLLNMHSAGHSSIYEEGMVNFYSDNPFRFEAAVISLPAAVQGPLLQVLKDKALRLHCRSYSLTSHPWSLSTQNSNQWVLEVLAAALAGAEHRVRPQLQDWLKASGYAPSELAVSLPTQWAGPLLKDSISFADQPALTRRQGRVHTVTVDSVEAWLQGETSPFGADRAQCRTTHLHL